MRSIYLIALFLLFLGQVSLAQNDSLVFPDEIHFHSGAEEWIITKYIKGKPVSPFELFSATDAKASQKEILQNKTEFNSFLDQNKKIVESQKNNYRKVKKVFTLIHKAYFKRYNPGSSFNDIFTKGDFNCVSGTALFALAFDKYEIPYRFIEQPTHLYLLTYPDSDMLVVESTNGVDGVIKPKSSSFKKHKNHLLKYKLIDPVEYDTLEFSDFHVSIDTFDIYGLTGIFYYNLALKKGNIYQIDFDYTQKAYLFQPNAVNAELLMVSANNLLIKQMEIKEYYRPIITLARSPIDRFSEPNYFHDLRFKIKTADDLLSYTLCYEKLIPRWPESNTTKADDISAIYYETCGDFYFNQLNYKKAYKSYLEQFKHQKNNQNFTNLIRAIDNYFNQNLDADKIIEDLNTSVKDNPELMNNPQFRHLYYFYLLNNISYHYAYRNLDKAEALRTNFEENYRHIQSLNAKIEETYKLGVTVYYHKNNIRMAKKLVNKGLDYFPLSSDLQKLKLSLYHGL